MATAAVLSSSTQNYNHSSPFDATPNLYKLRTLSPNIRRTDRIFLVQASSKFQTQREEENRASNGKQPFISQEDLSYVVKLGGGSVVGAAAIKYGSIMFPEITRPNIAQAMTMISAPVLLAVLFLIIHSRPTTK